MRTPLATCLALLALAAPAAATPEIAAPPEIAGEPIVGRTLSATPLSLVEADPADAMWTWERDAGTGFAAIPDVHDATYRIGREDLGARLRVRVLVETADGTAEAISGDVGPITAAPASGPLRIGPAPGAAVRLARWTVVAGATVAVRGAVPAGASAAVVLVPTVAGVPEVRADLSVAGDGAADGAIAPAVNSVAWLELQRTDDTEPVRVLLGVVGVRPRVVLRLAARPDGVDGSGRPLIRDLAIAPGSGVGVPGLRLAWEGILPGERRGTAVCRVDERPLSGADGTLRGGCATRGAWAAARWRLVYAPGTDDVGSAPFLPAASPWVRPRVGRVITPPAVAVLPRACATLRPWTSPSSRTSSSRTCPAAAPR